MNARDRLWSMLWDNYKIDEKNAALDAYRAQVLHEAADFVRDAHFRDGLSVQEIGAALRYAENEG